MSNQLKTGIVAASGVLACVGLGAFAWKVAVLEIPLVPNQPAGLWQIGVRITAIPEGGSLSIQAPLATPEPGQAVFGEQFTSGTLRLQLRDEGERGRLAEWRGVAEQTVEVDLRYRVQLSSTTPELDVGQSEPPPDELLDRFCAATPSLPATAEPIVELIDGLPSTAPRDFAGRVRQIYALVRHDIRPGTEDDPVVVLQRREGSQLGRERLLATLLRAAGIPARIVQGLQLAEPKPSERVWTEVWVAGAWVPLSASDGFVGAPPHERIVLARDHVDELFDATGVRSLDRRYSALRARLSRQELASLMVPNDPILRALSLHRLPIGMQAALRVLLLMPVAALLLTVLRNVVGMPSYGTFMPMLVALALRSTGLGVGLSLVVLVLAIGVAGRLFVTHLRLLLVPRLSLLLCVVVLSVTALGLLGFETDERSFFAGVVFPIVILTMLVERFSITLTEEGLWNAGVRASSSLAIAIIVYPVFRIEPVEQVFFNFPELILVVMSALVLLGGYTGYRLTDLHRFRQIAERVSGT